VNLKRDGRRLLRRVDEALRTRRNLRRIAAVANGDRGGVLEPRWPLPRAQGGPSDAEILARAARHPQWLYRFDFEGGLRVPQAASAVGRLGDASPERPLQRFRHFMPAVVAAAGGSLAGKRVLDIACNAGFWSIQCALLGAREVVGFDARPERIEQATLVSDIVGLRNVRFQVLDYWGMSPDALGGTFDVVLHLGLLYHLPKPVEALELTRRVARDVILLDTALYVARGPMMLLAWEESGDIGSAAETGMVMFPSKRSVEMLLRHVGLPDAREIPLRSAAMPPDYLRDGRASWIVRVPASARRD